MESQNPRRVWMGGDLKAHPIPPSASHNTRVLRAPRNFEWGTICSHTSPESDVTFPTDPKLALQMVFSSFLKFSVLVLLFQSKHMLFFSLLATGFFFCLPLL